MVALVTLFCYHLVLCPASLEGGESGSFMAVLPRLTQWQAHWLPFTGTPPHHSEVTCGMTSLAPLGLPSSFVSSAGFLSQPFPQSPLVSTYYVPGIALDTGGGAKKDEALVLRE